MLHLLPKDQVPPAWKLLHAGYHRHLFCPTLVHASVKLEGPSVSLGIGSHFLLSLMQREMWMEQEPTAQGKGTLWGVCSHGAHTHILSRLPLCPCCLLLPTESLHSWKTHCADTDPILWALFPVR